MVDRLDAAVVAAAVAPAAAGSIPLQLVKANPAMGSGMALGVSHIQRVATRGGVAPAACTNGVETLSPWLNNRGICEGLLL